MMRAGAAALGVALLAAVCAPCAATDIPLPDPYEEEEIVPKVGEGPAIKHFNRGVALFKTEQYEAALAEFQASYEHKPNWAVLYNIGVCYHRLGRFDDALRELEEYLERGGAWIPPNRKSFVKQLIDQMEVNTGTIVIDHAQPGARVWIDETRVFETPVGEPVQVASGLHTVKAYREGYYPIEQEVSVPGGTEVSVPLEFEPTPMYRTWLGLHGPTRRLSTLGRLRIAAATMWGIAGLTLTGAVVTTSIELAMESESGPLELATTIQLISAAGTAVTGLLLWLCYRVGLRKRMAHGLPWLAVAPAGPEGGAVLTVGFRTR